jgi:hypothetical protein
MPQTAQGNVTIFFRKSRTTQSFHRTIFVWCRMFDCSNGETDAPRQSFQESLMPSPARTSKGNGSETGTAHLGPSATAAATLALRLGLGGLALGGCSASNYTKGGEQNSQVGNGDERWDHATREGIRSAKVVGFVSG